MALHFGKRDTEPTNTFTSNSGAQRYGAPSPSTPMTTPAAASSSPANVPPSSPDSPTTSTGESGSKLIVGPNIKLKGVEITDCDTLFVEGLVEATMDSRVIHIAEQGAFKGTAEIDIAEIHGVFDGNLTVRQKLVIYASGKVTGKIRYGKVVIEEGGQLSGDIECSVSSTARTTSNAAASAPQTVKPAMALAA